MIRQTAINRIRTLKVLLCLCIGTFGYIQGSKTGAGIYIGEGWNSEVMVTNTRIFGNGLSGVVLGGGSNALFSNNIIAENSIQGQPTPDYITALFSGHHFMAQNI